MPGRLSNSSSPTQATAPGSAIAHKARAIVLPAPGGPVTIVSGHHRVPSAISLVIRGRGTAQCGTSGGVIFEVRIGSPTDMAGRRPRVDAWLAPSAVIDTSRSLQGGPSPLKTTQRQPFDARIIRSA